MIKYSDVKVLLKRVVNDEEASIELKQAMVDKVRDSLRDVINLNTTLAHACDALDDLERRVDNERKRNGSISQTTSDLLDSKYDEVESLKLNVVHNLEDVNSLFERYNMEARFQVNEDSDYLEVAQEIEDLSSGMIRNGAENMKELFKNRNLTLSEQYETRRALEKVDNLVDNANASIVEQVQRERASSIVKEEETDTGFVSRFAKNDDKLVYSTEDKDNDNGWGL